MRIKYRSGLTVLALMIWACVEVDMAWGVESTTSSEQKVSANATEKLVTLWSEALDLLKVGNYEAAKLKLTQVNSVKYELGLENLIIYADVLIKESKLLEEKGNAVAAANLLEMASKLAPYNWRVRFALVKLYLSKLDLYRSFKEFFRGLKDKVLDIYTFCSSLNRVTIILSISLLTAFSVVIVFSFIQVHRAVFFDIKERLPSSLPAFSVYIVGWLFLGMVLWLGGFFWFVLLLSILTWGYLDAYGKKFIQAFLIFVLFLPLFLLVIGTTLRVYNSPYIKALYNVSYGTYTEETENILKKNLESDPLDLDASFSLAFLNKKRGLLGAAEQGYKDLINRSYQLDKVYNNLGNVYYAQKRFDDAIKVYERALERNPNLFSAHYNLAQAYLQKVTSDKATDALNQAQRLDFNRFSEIQEISKSGSHYNLVLVDETLPRSAVFKTGLKFWRQGYEVSGKIWGLFSKVENPFYLPGIAILAWGLILALDKYGRNGGYAYYCEMCGDPVSQKSQKTGKAKKLCTQCSYIFVKKGVLNPEKREEKRRQIQIYEQTRKWLARLISILIPGSGHIYAGFIGKGFVIAGLTAILFFSLYFQDGILHEYTGVLSNHAFSVSFVKLVVLSGVYLFTLRDIFFLSPKN